jgi:hypothetical protein
VALYIFSRNFLNIPLRLGTSSYMYVGVLQRMEADDNYREKKVDKDV